MPAPKVLSLSRCFGSFLLVRNTYYFAVRVFICEPFFKAYCTKYGRNLHTGCYLHWVTGKGDIILGDNVTVDGKIASDLRARFSDHPTLRDRRQYRNRPRLQLSPSGS